MTPPTHDSAQPLLLDAAIDDLVDRALAEDLSAGDITSEACVGPEVRAVAHAVARNELVACGGPVFARVFSRIDGGTAVERHVSEGALAPAGARLWTARGTARALLMAERTALNFVQRMSGIATVTRKYVSALPPKSTTRVIDTRKTTPGLRVLERYAVRVGGGRNHRDNLGSAVLIKDNHVVASGGIAAAIARAKKFAPHTSRIECEVDSLEQLDEALRAGADIVLLDNMSNEQMGEAVKRTAGRAILEASGGITVERIAALAAIGVDAISVGALTHSAPAADIGLDFES